VVSVAAEVDTCCVVVVVKHSSLELVVGGTAGMPSTVWVVQVQVVADALVVVVGCMELLVAADIEIVVEDGTSVSATTEEELTCRTLCHYFEQHPCFDLCGGWNCKVELGRIAAEQHSCCSEVKAQFVGTVSSAVQVHLVAESASALPGKS